MGTVASTETVSRFMVLGDGHRLIMEINDAAAAAAAAEEEREGDKWAASKLLNE